MAYYRLVCFQKCCWLGIEGLILSQSQPQLVPPRVLLCGRLFVGVGESVTFWSWVLKSFRKPRFLIELPSSSVLFLAPSRYCVDVRIKLPVASTHLVNNNIFRRLIRSLSFCLRLDECLSVWKSSIFTSYQRNDNFVANVKLAIINLKYFWKWNWKVWLFKISFRNKARLRIRALRGPVRYWAEIMLCNLTGKTVKYVSGSPIATV